MAKFVALQEEENCIVFAKHREDGSLIMQCRFYDPIKGGFAGMEQIDLEQEGVKALKILLDTRSPTLREADGDTCPSCDGSGYRLISPTIRAECHDCDGSGHV